MTYRLLISTALCCLSGPALADNVLYECTVTEKRAGLDWISDQVGIIVQPGNTAMVLDGVILYFIKRPIAASSVRDTEASLDVRWSIEGARDSENVLITHFDYNARIDKTSGDFALHAKPDNYANRFSGTGHCVTRTAD
jgi:hypothetical protein